MLKHPEMNWDKCSRRLLNEVMAALYEEESHDKGAAEYWLIEAIEAHTRQQKRTAVLEADVRTVVRAAITEFTKGQ